MNRSPWPLIPLAAAGLTAQSGAWYDLPVTPQTDAVAWDAARNRLVMIGPGTPQRMWEWDGVEVRERQLAMANQPNVRQLAWDARLQQLVAIGTNGPGWWVGTWQAAGWTWRTGGTVPPVDALAAIALDSARGRLVLYRGPTTGSTLHEWDGQQWWLVADNVGPAARSGASFAYDPVGQRCVLYGGSSLADTWAWDGFQWTQIAAASAPGPRHEATLGFDPAHGALVLYGGEGTATSTWLLAGATWTQLVTANDPGPRRRPRLFADGQGLLLIGGSPGQIGSEFDPAGALWRFQNGDWHLVAHLPNPTPVNNTGVAYDRVRRQVVSFSWTPMYALLPHPDHTLVFDGRWRHVVPAHEPSWRHTSPLCWSSPDQRVLLFGGGAANGALDDTWTWDGVDWRQETPASSPPPRWGHLLAEDPGGGVLLFGGTDGTTARNDHWRWDGATWQPVTVTLPGPRVFTMGALDPAHGQVLLFGGLLGLTLLSDTWRWDGAAWTQLTPATVPSEVASMAFRPATQRLALAGRNGYEWTGSDWLAVAGLGRPYVGTQTFWARLVADPDVGRLLDVQPPRVSVFTTHRAAVARFGSGCARDAAPTLDGIDEPAPGVAFAVEIGARLPGTPAFLVVGLGTQSQPLGNGCASMVATQLAVNSALTNGGGVARFPVGIPYSPSLRGVEFSAQGAAWNPAQSWLGTVTLTAGLRVTIGD